MEPTTPVCPRTKAATKTAEFYTYIFDYIEVHVAEELEIELSTARKIITLEQEYVKEFHKALEALERAGWPCRLEELPDEYVKMGRKLQDAEEDSRRYRWLQREIDMGRLPESIKEAIRNCDGNALDVLIDKALLKERLK